MEELLKSTLIDLPRAGLGGQLPVHVVRFSSYQSHTKSSHVPDVSGLQAEYVCANTLFEASAAVSSSEDSDAVFMMEGEFEGEECKCLVKPDQ